MRRSHRAPSERGIRAATKGVQEPPLRYHRGRARVDPDRAIGYAWLRLESDLHLSQTTSIPWRPFFPPFLKITEWCGVTTLQFLRSNRNGIKSRSSGKGRQKKGGAMPPWTSSHLAYWQPVNVRVLAVTDIPATTTSGAFELVWLGCISDGLQSAWPADPGTNASASTV